jgi:MATE family multidrug resistance protein
MIPALLANSMRSFLSGMQLTTVQIWVTLVALVMNAGINYALIFGRLGAPEMGIQGAAVASVFVQTLTFVVLAIYAQVKFPEAALFQRIWRPDWQALREVFRIGLPIGLTSLAEGGLFSASAVMMGWIGELELAAHGIALQITALFFMFHVGMSQAATVRAGGAYGRRNEVELRRWGRTALAVSWSFGVLAIVLMVTLPGQMVALFVDPDEPARATILSIGTTLVLLSALFQFVDATQIVALALLRGVQDTAVPMWLASVSYWMIGLPASYVMAFVLGWAEVGIWLGLTVGLGAASVGLMTRFWVRSVRIAA